MWSQWIEPVIILLQRSHIPSHSPVDAIRFNIAARHRCHFAP
jgi:hypothetical protein